MSITIMYPSVYWEGGAQTSLDQALLPARLGAAAESGGGRRSARHGHTWGRGESGEIVCGLHVEQVWQLQLGRPRGSWGGRLPELGAGARAAQHLPRVRVWHECRTRVGWAREARRRVAGAWLGAG